MAAELLLLVLVMVLAVVGVAMEVVVEEELDAEEWQLFSIVCVHL